MKILLSSAVVDTRDSLWIDEYVCVYIYIYVSMSYVILHIMHKHHTCSTLPAKSHLHKFPTN